MANFRTAGVVSVPPAVTSTQVPYGTGTGITSEAALAYDAATNTLSYGIGTVATSITSPIVYGSAASGGNLAIQSTSHATQGYVGIGDSTMPTYGYLRVGTASGTVPFAFRQGGAEGGTPTLAWFETASGNLGYFGADTGYFVIGGLASKGLQFKTNVTGLILTLQSGGGINCNGNTISGSTADSGDLTLDSTSHATKGQIVLNSQVQVAANSITANGAQTVTVGNLGPGGAGIAIVEWLTIITPGGTRYIPCFA